MAQLTQRDIDKMKEEIEYRKVTVRKNLLEDVKEARAHGDLSENFEYQAAKKEKNRNESRIRYLEKMIRTAELVTEDPAGDRAGLNKTVTLYFEDEDEEETFSFVTTVLIDALKNRVSIESPLGRAVSGHRGGDRVHVSLNERDGYYVVIKSVTPFEEDVPLNAY